MNRSRYERAKEIFLAARDCLAEDRRAYVVQVCGNDVDLLREVESLLAHADEAPGLPDAVSILDPVERFKTAIGTRYAIERQVGRGGMATVYLAQDLKHHRKVAVKVLRPDLAATMGADRFLREVKIAAKLSHPHILPLYDSGAAGGFLYYVMPFVDGESLRDRLEREGELPITEAVRILRDVVDALAKAHLEGVIHRDVKPDNVMLSDRHALVTDFGVAKGLSQATSSHGLTTAGVVLGTPAYMAPEQVAADRSVDHRADIYAVGALAYELLTGRPPFLGSTPQAVLASHLTETAEPITKHREDVPVELEMLVMRCLEKKPADRWQTTEELLVQLEGLVTPMGGVTPTDTRPLSPVSRLLSHSRFVTLVGGAAAVLVMVVGWFAFGSDWVASAGSELPRVLVLPARNLGSADNAYFADGIGEEISTRLGRISGLKVIGRMSAKQYRDTEKTPREIGDELDVDFLLHVTVRGEASAASGRVRVNTELVSTASAAQVWAQSFVPESIEDLFQAQSHIAEQVAREVGVTLLEREEEVLAFRPTNNPEAYDYYLRGNAAYNRSQLPEDYRAAVNLYQRAVEQDPNFAAAYAGISKAHTEIYWVRGDRSTRRLTLAKRAVDSALRLDPELPEAHFALGLYYYHGFLEYDRALEEFSAALRGEPSHAESKASIGYVYRRQGRLEEAAAQLARALDLEPRSHVIAYELGNTYSWTGRYTEAHRLLDRALDYAPEYPVPYQQKAYTYLFEGKLLQAQQILRRGIGRIGLGRLLSAPDLGDWADVLLLDEEDQRAVVRLSLSGDIPDTGGYYFARALVSHVGNDLTRARLLFDSARVVFEEKAKLYPDDPDQHVMLGLAFAGLGREVAAVNAGRRAIDLLPVSQDRWTGPDMFLHLGGMYVLLGKYDAAIEQFERTVADLAGNRPWLRHHPFYAPLRDNLRFQKLVGEAR